MSNQAWTISFPHFPIDHARMRSSGAGSTQKGNAAANTDHTQDRLTANFMTIYMRLLAGRRELRYQQILNLGTWIATAQQKSFAFEICPIDDFTRG